MEYVLIGLTIGLAAGISPGPLLFLVITSTLRDGWRAGVAAAAAPLLSDAVILVGVFAVLANLPRTAVDVLGVIGGLFVIWLGVQTVLEASTAEITRSTGESTGVMLALRRAVATNILSPHPWLTWATALGPLTLTTWRASSGGAVGLVVAFYVAIVGVKAAVAGLVAAGRHRLTTAGYRRALVGAGVLLLLAGGALVWEFAPALT